jgi:hypothetical protein
VERKNECAQAGCRAAACRHAVVIVRTAPPPHGGERRPYRNRITGLIGRLAAISAAFAANLPLRAAETVAFFPFDEPVGMYPSSVLSDHSAKNLLLILGPGGSIVPGKFGNALSTTPQPAVNYPAGSVLFGLTPLPIPPDRTVEPLSWKNARFAALMTSGEKHLRKEAVQPNATDTGLNLGAFDWTVEFWYRGESAPATNAVEATIFEVGEGPRGENDHVTALLLAADRASFTLVNQPSVTRVMIPSDRAALTAPNRWAHLAFVYRADRGEIAHFVDGRPVGMPVTAKIKALPHGDEAYCSVGRDARWERPLPGALDEFRVSRGIVYAGAFTPPGSFVAASPSGAPEKPPRVTEPLRFAGGAEAKVVNLGASKHLLLDDALFPEHTNLTFVPTPPDKVELAFEVEGSFRKHVVVIEDEQGLIRIYNPLANDRLGVRTSRDGLHFDVPRLATGEHHLARGHGHAVGLHRSARSTCGAVETGQRLGRSRHLRFHFARRLRLEAPAHCRDFRAVCFAVEHVLRRSARPIRRISPHGHRSKCVWQNGAAVRHDGCR